jgi:hypothetical protein
VGRVAVVVGGAKSEAYLQTKYPPDTAGDGKNGHEAVVKLLLEKVIPLD